MLLLEDGRVVYPGEYEKLQNILKKCGVENINLKDAYALQNDGLENAFEFHNNSLIEKCRSSPHLFKKEDWKSDEIHEERLWVYNHYNNLAKKYLDWSTSPDAPVIPVFQGTGKDTPWKIIQTGFCAVATLDDGFYGRGIYFSSNINYATIFSKIATKYAPLSYVMLAFISPGNIYPVREGPTDENSLKGKAGPISVGYQSHYVLVNPPGSKMGWIADMKSTDFVDEFVLFQEAQAVPKYLLVIKN